MMWFRKRQSERRLTGVGAVMCVSHRDQETGQMHGHTYEVNVWIPFGHVASALDLQRNLRLVIARLDHTVLPDELAWGEQLAAHIGRSMWVYHSTITAVEVNRPLERIYARWEA